MNIAQRAVERPIFTTMVVLIVLILGGLALSRLAVDLMPDITSPTISISTTYENASPEEIEELVTKPIEEGVSAVSGVQQISSTSTEGSSSVQVTFNWGTDLEAAANDLRDRLDRVVGQLPDEADRPVLRKFDMSSTPVVTLGVSSQMAALDLRKLVDEQIKYRLERVPGVAAVDIRGGLTREIHVDLDPDKIQALGLSMDQISSSIQESNINLPAGSVYIGNHDVTVRTPGVYTSLDELRNTTVALRNSSPVLLSQVAAVRDSAVKVTRVIRINGQPGLQLSINKQSGTNTVQVVQQVLKEVDRINADFTQLKLVNLMDSSVFIRQAVSNVASSALIGGILAIFILLVFLRNLKSTAIISTAIPVSVIATFGLIYFCGFTLNMMTLGGLALGIGMLLDNSIVVLENIFRLREQGRSRLQAAIDGTAEVAAPIVASTITTLVVFLPLIFVRGMTGIMFKQLAFVIGFSMLCSLVTALTLVPMLSGRWLTVANGGTSRFFKLSESYFDRLENKYKQMLHWSLTHRKTIIIGTAVLLAGCIAMIPLIGTELMPSTDEGEIRVDLEMEVGTRLEITAAMTRQAEQIAMKSVPEIKNCISSAGGSGWGSNTTNAGQLRIKLVPLAQRKRSSDQVCNQLRQVLGALPGVTVRARSTSSLMFFRQLQANAGKLELDVRGHDFETAAKLAQDVKVMMETVPGIADVNISRSSGAPEKLVHVDRRKAESLGLQVQDVADMLETVLSGNSVGQYRENGDEYTIRMQVENAEALSMDRLLNLSIANDAGHQIALANVVTVEDSKGNTEIDRLNQERTVSVTANISDRSESAIRSDIDQKLHEMTMPADFTVGFGGDYDEQQRSFKDLLLGFILALILVYMVMACQYESLRDPLIVMFSVPLAVIGVVLMLFFTGTTFNIQSYIGCIMLGGIVVNNAILLVDTTNLLRRRDKYPVGEAIEEAGRRRLRPILMTALTSMLGLIPMAIGMGEGGETQAPLARAVVGGLLSSTLITLLVVPVVYSLFEQYRQNKNANSEQ